MMQRQRQQRQQQLRVQNKKRDVVADRAERKRAHVSSHSQRQPVPCSRPGSVARQTALHGKVTA